MTDKTFELSMKLLTLLVILAIIAGIIFKVDLALVIIGAIVIEAGVGTVLLRVWGKSYMSRT